MIKKQTVWLLTMLSLMIVLSVYYILSPPEDGDIAFKENQNENEQFEQNDQSLNDLNTDEAEVTNITNRGQDELFTMMRMEVQNDRSMSKERYNDIVKSSSATAEEKNDALNNMQEIDEITTKETILQEKIMSGTDKYDDVFVRHDQSKVHVHVLVDDLSKQEANHIMQLVRNEFGEIPVEVNFNPKEE